MKNPFDSHTASLLLILVILDMLLIMADSFHQFRYVPELLAFQGAAFVSYAGKNAYDNYTQVKYSATVQGSANLPGPGR